jgi:ribosome-binding protein aMBF1 (putative translation factor)
VITGSQIQTARSLLGWDRKHLARACKLRIETLARAESAEGEPPITVAHAQVIRAVLEQAGIEFPTGAATSVALRTKPAA